MELLNNFSDQTRVWIYQSNRLLQATEIEKINLILGEFSKEWATHGNQMASACFVIEPCFIVMAVDQSIVSASGCSIDSSVKILKMIEEKFDISLFDRLNLSYLDSEGNIQLIPMAEFQNGLKSGLFNEDTVVFNNLIDNLPDLRNNWKTTVAKSWHQNLIVK